MKQSFLSVSIAGWMILIVLLAFGARFSPVGAFHTVKIIYFYADGCHDCQKIKESYLPKILLKYGKAVSVQYYDFLNDADYRRLLELERKLGRKINKTPPVIFIGADCLEGAATIRKKLPGLIDKYLHQKR